MSINKVVVAGNLTRAPELRMAGSTPVLELSIAVNDRKKNNHTGQWEDIPNFFDAVVWGSRAESLSRFLQKGTKVVIAGRLHYRQWQDRDGSKRSKVEIVADDVEFMSSSNQSYAPAAEPYSGDIPF